MARKIKRAAPPPPLTLEERRDAALASSAAALSVFQRAADDLVDSAYELDEVEAAATSEAQRLTALADQALAEANQRRAQADAIYSLLGTNQD